MKHSATYFAALATLIVWQPGCVGDHKEPIDSKDSEIVIDTESDKDTEPVIPGNECQSSDDCLPDHESCCSSATERYCRNGWCVSPVPDTEVWWTGKTRDNPADCCFSIYGCDTDCEFLTLYPDYNGRCGKFECQSEYELGVGDYPENVEIHACCTIRDRCGSDISFFDNKQFPGECMEHNQPGIPDTKCSDNEIGCCSDDGFCGSTNPVFGCIYADWHIGPPCGTERDYDGGVDRDAGPDNRHPGPCTMETYSGQNRKTTMRITYTYDFAGNLITEEIDNGANGTLDECHIYTYDPVGNLLSKESDFNCDGDADQNTIYKHDEDGRLLSEAEEKMHKTIEFDTEGNLLNPERNIRYTNYYYDAKGRLSVKEEEDLHTRYTYETGGRIVIEERDRDADGTIDSCCTTFSNRNLKKISDECDHDADSIVDDRTMYTYDEDGNLAIEKSMHVSYGRWNSRYFFYYDENDNLVHKSYRTPKEFENSSHGYSDTGIIYSYDCWE